MPTPFLRRVGALCAYLTLPAIATVPLGGYLLLTVDPDLARKSIAAVVIVFSLMLLIGLRYNGSPRPLTSIAIASVVGAMLGATSIGAPPVILYLLSGPESVAVTRANLTIFVTTISGVGLVMLATVGVVTTALGLSALVLSVVFLFATWIGGKLFLRLSEIAIRRIALVLMLAASITSFIL